MHICIYREKKKQGDLISIKLTYKIHENDIIITIYVSLC